MKNEMIDEMISDIHYEIECASKSSDEMYDEVKKSISMYMDKLDTKTAADLALAINEYSDIYVQIMLIKRLLQKSLVNVNKSLQLISETFIPEIMDTCDLTLLKTKSGVIIDRVSEIDYRMPKEDSSYYEEVIDWLSDEGYTPKFKISWNTAAAAFKNAVEQGKPLPNGLVVKSREYCDIKSQ